MFIDSPTPNLFRLLFLLSIVIVQPDTLAEQPVRAKLPMGAKLIDWPRFLNDGFDGHSQTDPSALDWSQSPSLAWSIRAGEGYGLGSVARGAYFQSDTDPESSELQIQERLRAFDLATGKELWSSSQPILYRDMLGYEDGPRASPTVVDGLVYTLGVTGRLTCRFADDGEISWTVDTNKEYGVVQNFFGVGSAPLVIGDHVIVMVGGSPPEDQAIAPMRLGSVSPNGSALVCFDRNSGNEVWKCGDDLASYSSPRLMKVGEETLVLVFARDHLLAVDPDAR